MLSVQAVGVSRAEYHRGGEPGRWVGTGAARLGLEPGAEVTYRQVTDLLGGRDPASGRSLVDRARARRRPGWELVIAAPKSVSLLAALAGGDGGARLAGAHCTAAAAAFAYLERHATFTRRASAPLAGGGLVAVQYSHRWSAAGDPHLHTHVVIANLTEADGRWSALHGQALWWHARAAGAVYHLALRHDIARAGLPVRWHVGPGGAADVVGVPRAAIDAASTRRAQLLADAGERQSAAAREVGRRRTRSAGAPGLWLDRVTAAGFGAAGAGAILAGGPGISAPRAPSMVEVETELLAVGSRFRPSDVWVALASVAPAGMRREDAEGWVGAICARARPAGGGTYVSARAAEADAAVTAAALSRAGCGAGMVAGHDPSNASAPGTAAADERGPFRNGAEEAANGLISAGHGVEVLGAAETPSGRAPLLAQAAVIDVARRAWQEAGHTVVIVAGSAAAAARWEALTGLRAHGRTGAASTGFFAENRVATPTVLVVDRADRLATPELGALLAGAAANAAKVVLVEGGSSPPRRVPRSAVLTGIAGALGRLDPGPQPDVGLPLSPTIRSTTSSPALSVALSGEDAIAHLVATWAAQAAEGPAAGDPSARPGAALEAPLMVAPGAAEAGALNQAARARLIATGAVAGPSVEAGGLALQAGDRVIALRRGAASAGVLGRVETAGSPGRAQVRWTGGPVEEIGASTPAGALGYGYATTPALLRPGGPELLVLGDPRRLGPHRERVVAAWLVAGTRRREPPAPSDRLRGLLAGLAPAVPPALGLPAAPGLAGGLETDRSLPDRSLTDRSLTDRSLTDLGGERDALARRLMGSLPPDPRDDLRRLAEDRAWLATRPAANGLDREAERLEAAVARLERWVDAHGEQLRRWDDLGRAIEARADGLACLVRAGVAVAELDRGLDHDRARRAGHGIGL